MKSWKGKSIFISSTFKDFQAERTCIQGKIIPRINKELKKDGVSIDTVDLRWGSDDNDEHQLIMESTILKVCFDEIESCKPFIIVFVGDHYGCIPPKHIIERIVKEKGFTIDVHGKSVNALEIEHILNNNEQLAQCYFYFRNPLPYDKMDEALALRYTDMLNDEEMVNKLQNLKAKISERISSDRIRKYNVKWENEKIIITNDFEDMIYNDLLNVIKEELKKELIREEKVWPDLESKRIKEHIGLNSTLLVGREEALKGLVEFSLNYSNKVKGKLILGESGTGKSVLMCSLLNKLYGEDCFVLDHIVGISSFSTSVERMLERWIYKLCKLLDKPLEQVDFIISHDNLDNIVDFDKKLEFFIALIEEASEKTKIVCVIDGIDNFKSSNINDLINSDELWMYNIRVILSSHHELNDELINNKNLNVVKLNHLERNKDVKQIVNAVSEKYHKTIEESVIEIILSKKVNEEYACYNPLWLIAALEELMLIEDDYQQQLITSSIKPDDERYFLMLKEKALSLPSNINDLYQYIIGNAVSKFGSEFSMHILKLMAVSRYGLRTKDIKSIIKNQTDVLWSDLNYANLKRYLRAHLLKIEDQINFSHEEFRSCILNTFIKDQNEFKAYHKMIVKHLETLSNSDEMRRQEIAYHFYQADEKQKFLNIIREGNSSEKFYLVETINELLSKENECDNKVVLWIEAVKNIIDDIDDLTIFYINLLKVDVVLHNRISTRKLISLFEITLKSNQNINIRKTYLFYVSILVKCHDKLGELYIENEEYDKAEQKFKSSYMLEVEYLLDEEDLFYKSHLAFNLGKINTLRDKVNEAIDNFDIAIAIIDKLLRSEPDNIFFKIIELKYLISYCSLLIEQDNIEKTKDYYDKGIGFINELLNIDIKDKDDIGLISNYLAIAADFYKEQDRLKAINCYEICEKYIHKLREMDPKDLDSFFNLSIIYFEIGDLYKPVDIEKTIEYYEKSKVLLEEQYKNMSKTMYYLKRLSVNYLHLAFLYLESENVDKAIEYFTTCKNYNENLIGDDLNTKMFNMHLIQSIKQLGRIYLNINIDEAIKYYQENTFIIETLTNKYTDDIDYMDEMVMNFYELGGIYLSTDQFEKAKEFMDKNIPIARKLIELEPDDVTNRFILSDIYKDLGKVYLDDDNLDDARKCLEEENQLLREIIELSNNVDYYKKYVSNCFVLGRIYANQLDIEKAKMFLERSINYGVKITNLEPNHVTNVDILTNIYDELGSIYIKEENYEEAKKYYDLSYELLMNLNNIEDIDDIRTFASKFYQVGSLLSKFKENEKARVCLERAKKYTEELLLLDENNEGLNNNLSVIYIDIAGLLIEEELFREALDCYLKSNEIIEKDLKYDMDHITDIKQMTNNYSTIGNIYIVLDDLNNGIAHYINRCRLDEILIELEPENIDNYWNIAITYSKLSDLYTKIEDSESCLIHLQNSMKYINLLIQDETNNEKYLNLSQEVNADLGLYYLNHEDYDNANNYYQDCIQNNEKLIKLNPDNVEYKVQLADNYIQLFNISLETEKYDQAFERCLYSTKILQDLLENDSNKDEYFIKMARNKSFLGIVCEIKDDVDSGKNYYNEAYQIIKSLVEKGSIYSYFMVKGITSGFIDLGFEEKAIHSYNEIINLLYHFETDHSNEIIFTEILLQAYKDYLEICGKLIPSKEVNNIKLKMKEIIEQLLVKDINNKTALEVGEFLNTKIKSYRWLYIIPIIMIIVVSLIVFM